MPTPPLSLTAAQLRNPHRGIASRTHGPISYLEQSFANGNLAEMEYWIASGVVEEAMAGKARSKRTYTFSLMNLLTGKMAVSGIPEDPNDLRRMGAILDTLWTQGAAQYTQHYDAWLKRSIAWPFADLLLQEGACPWTQLEEGHHRVKRSAIDQGLSLMSLRNHWRTFSKQGQDFEQLPCFMALEERIDRCLGMAGMTQESLDTALYTTAVGMLPQHQTRQADTRWRKWRTQLLELGARAAMVGDDALFALASAAHQRPVGLLDISHETWNLRHERRQALEDQRKSGDYKTIDLPELSPEEIKSMAQRASEQRALRWIKVTNEWIDALEPMLATPLMENESNVAFRAGAHRIEIWSKLMDAPGGQDVARRLCRLLATRGQVLPWMQEIEGSGNSEMGALTAREDQRSIRKMEALLDLLSLPEVNQAGIRDSWRRNWATTTLRLAPCDPNNDALPGLALNLSSGPHTYYRKGRDIQLPSAEEMDLILKLAGPLVVAPTENGNAWLVGMLESLPGLWKKHETPVAERRALLDVMEQHDALGSLLPGLATLGGAMGQDHTEAKQCLEIINEVSGRWWHTWAKDYADQDMLAQVIEVGRGATNRDVATGVRRMSLWCQLMGVQQDVGATLDRPLMGTDLARDLAQDPAGIALLGRMGFCRFMDKDSKDQRGTLIRAKAFTQLRALGWEPEDPQALSALLRLYLGTQRDVPSPELQLMVGQAVVILAPDPEQQKLDFLEYLMQLDDPKDNAKQAWSYLGGEWVAQGLTPHIRAEQRLLGTLAHGLGVAVDRRELAKVAGQTRGDYLTPRAGQRM